MESQPVVDTRVSDVTADSTFDVLFARQSEAVSQRVRSEIPSASDAEALERWVKESARKRFELCNSGERTFENLVGSRCVLALLRHFSGSAQFDAARLQILILELQNANGGFQSVGSTDETLLALEARHNPDALYRLWSLHSKTILGFLRIRARNNSDADDILHNTFLALLAGGIDHFDPTIGRFLTWAHHYALGLCKRFYMGTLSQWVGAGEEPSSTILEPIDPCPGPEKIAEDSERRSHALRMMFRLTSPPHQLIVFAYDKLLEIKPRRIVLELASFTLSELAFRLETALTVASALTQREITEALRDLKTRLRRKFEEVIEHPRILRELPALHGRIVGSIALEEFYPRNGEREDVVAKWAGNVWKMLRKRMLSPAPGATGVADSEGAERGVSGVQEADHA